MARIKLVEQNEVTGDEKERYDELAGRNAVTNMKILYWLRPWLRESPTRPI